MSWLFDELAFKASIAYSLFNEVANGGKIAEITDGNREALDITAYIVVNCYRDNNILSAPLQGEYAVN